MTSLKIIKTDSEYRAALAEIEALIDRDPAAGTPEAEQLEVLALLVETYEKSKITLALPDPVEAIEFRMEQQNLSARDLVPYLGSRSKVSEILGRKRPLTLTMIRALHDKLGIPAKVLIQDRQHELRNDSEEADVWSKYPIKEMIARRWIKDSIESITEFCGQLPTEARTAFLYRKTANIRSARNMDRGALAAWLTRITIKAGDPKALAPFRRENVNLEMMRALAKTSSHENGPAEAQDFLYRVGIPLVIEPHLPQTYLDGAAILFVAERPIIGLSIRHDRLDNFWFTLMHEVAHIALHSNSGRTDFIDDLDVETSDDPQEQQADDMAGKALIPEESWERSPARTLKSPQAAHHLAKQLGIHPAIVAGRMRHHWKDYRLLKNYVGHRDVRRHFPQIEWPD